MDEMDWDGQPRYVQIAQTITEWIRMGRFAAGDRLPAERQLAQDLGVSRMTVRQAVGVLTQQGLINSHQGSGNYVTRPVLDQPVDVLIGFSDNLIKRGVTPGARVLDLHVAQADAALAQALQIAPDDPVLAVRRLRLANAMPVALEHSYFPERYFPRLAQHDLETRSIYAILAQEYGVQLAGAYQTLEPVVALPDQAALLQIAEGAPLMLVTRTSSDLQGRVVEYAQDLYRGDCFRFVSHSRSPLAGQ